MLKSIKSKYQTLATMLALCICSHLGAQMDSGGMHERLTSYNGLSANSVIQTIQDTKGYIWIATTNGLNRYDGKNIRVFKKDQHLQNSISNNHITCLMQDKDGFLWVGTKNGLNLKNEDDTFIKYLHDPAKNNSLSNNKVQYIREDKNGKIWIATEAGMNIMDKSTRHFIQYSIRDSKSTGLLSVKTIYEDSRGIIWLSSWDGNIIVVNINDADYDNLEFKELHIDTEHPLHNSSLNEIFEDDQGCTWAQQYNGDLFKIEYPLEKSIMDVEPEDIEFRKVDLYFPNSKDKIIRSCKHINGEGLYLNTNTNLKLIPSEYLCKTDGYAINKGIINIKEIDLSSSGGNHIYRSSDGITWISTNNGLFKYFGTTKKDFNKHLEDQCKKHDLVISGIHCTKNGTLLLGTSKGLYYCKEEENSISIIEDDSKLYNSIENAVSFHEDSKGQLWVGTINGRLYKVSPNGTKTNAIHLRIPFLDAMTNNNHIWGISSNYDGTVWLATHQGLIIIDPETGKNEKHITQEVDSLQGHNIFDIVKDGDETFWLSCAGGGLTKATFSSTGSSTGLNFTQLSEDPSKVNSINDNIIFDLEKIGDEIWIAMVSGIQKYNIKEDSFYTNETLESNITEHVTSISHDSENIIWFTTNNGLFSYDEKKDLLSSFNSIDGVSENLVLLGSTRNSSGKLFFAGKNSLNSFYGNELLDAKLHSEVILTDLKIHNQSVIKNEKSAHSSKPILTDDLNNTESIVLNYKHKDVSIDFTMLDFIDPFQYTFRYKLEGFSEQWKELGTKQTISFPNLPYGNLKLLLKAKNKYGHWTETKAVNLFVAPPIWENKIFHLICLFVLSTMLYSFIRIKERRSTILKKKLEGIVSERTKELSAKNVKLKSYIESNLKLEQFAHIAAHDLKTPLRTISSYTGLLRKKIHSKINEHELNYFNYIEDATKRLYALIGDLMAFSQLDAIELNLKEENPADIINKVIDQLEIAIVEKGAEISIDNSIEKVMMDEMKMSRVFQNIISNSIKFVKPGIAPRISIKTNQVDKYWIFEISDNGIGIAIENQSKIFEVFNRGKQDLFYEGTGMGLATCKKIIDAHKGSITVESEEDIGSTFIIMLPKSSFGENDNSEKKKRILVVK